MIRELPEDKITEVADFVQFLRFKSDESAHAATKLSEQAFQEVWDNPDDAEYDQL